MNAEDLTRIEGICQRIVDQEQGSGLLEIVKAAYLQGLVDSQIVTTSMKKC